MGSKQQNYIVQHNTELCATWFSYDILGNTHTYTYDHVDTIVHLYELENYSCVQNYNYTYDALATYITITSPKAEFLTTDCTARMITLGDIAEVVYRFGFQGQEAENELYGAGNASFFKYRISDNRLGRFFAIDPLAAEYPHNSPYAFSENRVISAVELEGLEADDLNDSPPNFGDLKPFPRTFDEATKRVGTPTSPGRKNFDENTPLANFEHFMNVMEYEFANDQGNPFIPIDVYFSGGIAAYSSEVTVKEGKELTFNFNMSVVSDDFFDMKSIDISKNTTTTTINNVTTTQEVYSYNFDTFKGGKVSAQITVVDRNIVQTENAKQMLRYIGGRLYNAFESRNEVSKHLNAWGVPDNRVFPSRTIFPNPENL